ncbi:hypothetical protein TWF706_003541 [Orbilia oligospora]|nr:hypothetical protein TWF103_006689 [Orbilia oligospora]KAF3106160.1 hypothetical protein TWF706_003541 [Orbilia oligospora]
MAEAIGLASGILALASAAIKTTKAVVEIINGIKDAPSHISDLQHDVQSLRSILLRLETAEKQRLASSFLNNNNKLNNSGNNSKNNSKTSLPGANAGAHAGEDEYDTIRDQLKHCKTVLKGVEDELMPIMVQMKGGKKQVVWASICVAFTEKSIKEHSSRLYKAKTELLVTMVIDIRFAVLASTNKQQPQTSNPTIQADDPPPEYPGPDPKIKRRDSNLLKDTLRSNSVINRFKSSGSSSKTAAKDETSAQDENSKLPTFSQVISSTMDNMSKSVANETKGDYSISTFKMLWKDDLERIQSLWSLEKETVQHLKRTINDHMCEIFTSSVSANITTMNDIKDAAEGTLTWIDSTDEYTQWQSPSDHKVLLLEGKAGSGKSVFTKTLCRTITQNSSAPEKETPVLLSYFCNKRVRAQESCIEILKAFVCQYLKENKGDFTTVYKQCQSLCDQWDPAQPGQFKFGVTNLLDIFTTILQVSKNPVYGAIDAMDECHSDRDMEEFMTHLPSLLKSNTNFRLFMSSRPDWIADNDLSEFKPLKIILHPGITEKDISQVIELELCRLQTKLTIDEKDKLALKRKLTNKAEGMMLWVVLAFRRIQDHIKRMLSPTLKWLEKMVEKLPREIFGMYDHIMATIREKYGKTPHSPGEVDSSSEEEEDEESSNLAIYGKLVLWVARSGRPLTVKELQFALALDMKDKCLNDMKKKINCDIERVIGRIPFLEIISAERFAESPEDDQESRWGFFIPRQASTPSCTVRFIHQSAREYILRSADNPPTEKTPDDGTRFAYPKLDDACIGNLCVNFLSFRDFDTGPVHQFDEGINFKEGFKKFLEDCGFLEYCASYWGYHLNRASNLDDATKAHVADWISNRKNNMRLYFQVVNYTAFGRWGDYVDGEFGIIAAAGLGIGWLVDYMIQKGHNLDQRDEWGRTGYQLANGRGFAECAQKLEDAGAYTGQEFLINFPMGRMCWDTVTNLKNALEESGADDSMEAKDEFGRTAVFYACSRGDAELLSAVLEKNPDLGVKDPYGRLPIDVTIDLECRELMLAKMKKDGMKVTPAMAKKVTCLHDTFSYQVPYFLQTVYCNCCGRALRTFYFHCCGCSTEYEGFNICSQCHNNGKRCLDSTNHKLLGRVTADWLVSWLDYTPHMANTKVESPIKWSLDGIQGYHDQDDDEEEGDEDGSNVQEEEITPVRTVGTESVVYQEKDKSKGAVVRIQPVEEAEKGAGFCKCIVQ